MSRFGYILLAIAIWAATVPGDGSDQGGVGGTFGDGSIIARGEKPGDQGDPAIVDGSPGPVIRTIDCGPPLVGVNNIGGSDQGCGFVRTQCALAPGAPPPTPPVTTTVTQVRQPNGTWSRTSVDCAAAPGTGAPAITAAAVREEVIRLLPPVSVGVAPADGPTLVNMQTIFWVGTPADRLLPAVTVLGQQVAIRVHLDHVAWTFGDTATADSSTPGKPWLPGSCNTAQCPGYFGHTYTTVGAVTASAAITWTAEFRPPGQGWQAIPGTVTGPTTTHAVTVVQARAVLTRP